MVLNNIDNIKLGNNQINKIYLDTNEIWTNNNENSLNKEPNDNENNDNEP